MNRAVLSLLIASAWVVAALAVRTARAETLEDAWKLALGSD